jgi:hypothetical protein
MKKEELRMKKGRVPPHPSSFVPSFCLGHLRTCSAFFWCDWVRLALTAGCGDSQPAWVERRPRIQPRRGIRRNPTGSQPNVGLAICQFQSAVLPAHSEVASRLSKLMSKNDFKSSNCCYAICNLRLYIKVIRTASFLFGISAIFCKGGSLFPSP